ncbi:hypothetical protein ACVDG3_21710 [Meridianimarinicoccus sp. RP-17]|uniref:hypothetical protein n=1 Tax=Meridianimarinicoccus zhengii TaxID=2056810 RepID=UPI000DABAB56|nr:hypothetical protein [Phycocomes zhengii]
MCKDKKTVFNTDAPAFTPSGAGTLPPAPAMYYDGTDEGALAKEYFVVEGPCANFRTILPHGHVVYNMQHMLTNISYTSRNGAKIGTVANPTDWAKIRADSIPIHDCLMWFAAGCP